MEVSCSFDSSVVLGYSVMLQYAGRLNVETKETREVLSPVIFDGLNGGLFSVTVFPLTDNGVIGTSAVLTAPTTTPTPTSTPSSTSTPTPPGHTSLGMCSYIACVDTVHAANTLSFAIAIAITSGDESLRSCSVTKIRKSIDGYSYMN